MTTRTSEPTYTASFATAFLLLALWFTALYVAQIFNLSIAHAAENLVSNGSFEIQSSTSTPQNWSRGRWGTNTAVFSYPVTGSSGKAARVEITSRETGDAKWSFTRVNVEAGATYRYRNMYTATVPTYVTVEFRKADGSFIYTDLSQPQAAVSFTPTDVTFTVPGGVTTLTVFHLINSVGSLTIDEVSLEKVIVSPVPPPSPSNLIPNPSLEIANASGTNPMNWGRGRWGTNTAVFTYPTTGIHGERAARVELSQYTSGDAKWFFDRIAATPGRTYVFTDKYRSSATTYVTVEFRLSNGGVSYLDLGTLNATGSTWKTFEASFIAPAGATALTIFHLLKTTGSLEIDDYRLAQTSETFDQAHVTLTFDDGRRSTYDVGLPIVETAGFRSTHFIISGRMNDSFPGYIKPHEVLDIEARGHEIGAHTRTHADLAALTRSQMESEIAGSKNDLEALTTLPVTSLAYPYGSYNQTVIDVTRASGFMAARTTQNGTNPPAQNPYTLRRVAGDNATLSNLKAQVDQAIADKSWLIFAFHDITSTPGSYNTSPETLQGLVDYLKEKGVSVITLREGEALLHSP